MNTSMPFTRVATQRAATLEEVQSWEHEDEVQVDKDGAYVSYRQKPRGTLSETIAHVMTRSREDRRAHRDAIDKIASDINERQGPERHNQFRDRFALRKLLGQPITVDALHQFSLDVENRAMEEGPVAIITGAAIDFTRGIANLVSSEKIPSASRRAQSIDEATPSSLQKATLAIDRTSLLRVQPKATTTISPSPIPKKKEERISFTTIRYGDYGSTDTKATDFSTD